MTIYNFYTGRIISAEMAKRMARERRFTEAMADLTGEKAIVMLALLIEERKEREATEARRAK